MMEPEPLPLPTGWHSVRFSAKIEKYFLRLTAGGNFLMGCTNEEMCVCQMLISQDLGVLRGKKMMWHLVVVFQFQSGLFQFLCGFWIYWSTQFLIC